ncbi:unnamed protein product [Caenorhabditis auriculariae]|uniref:Lin-66-like winged helix domain-containing protein n=1 Tax=Caenorhabditis auriculariae TaxID=2777116 RepID=A0A8S1H817_9PELO|nr:unnamed protein product [Caenorhabditis auriculariae]
MTFELTGMFAPQPITPQHPNLWANIAAQQQFGTGPLNNLGILGNGTFNNHGNVLAQQQMMPPAPLEAPKAETIQGFGILTWLSAKAGLITCKDKMVISFQLKDFCDQMLNDLTNVLETTLVQPIYGPEAEVLFANAPEVDLEKAMPTPQNAKDAYSPTLEARAIPALLAIFQRHGLQQIQLSSLHSQMSNCGDDELFRYVGTSSLKRRQFVERRTHIFRLQNDDTIILQNPATYLCVFRLASYLLRRGGATAIQSLYDYYINGDIQQEIRDQIGEGRQDFLNIINSHNWVFALFPNRTYVSVRRNLPRYDYPGFVKQHFPELDVLRPNAQRNYGAPRSITRTLSAHQPMVGFQNVSSVNNARSAGGPLLSNNRPASLWDSQSSISQISSSATNDHWSPLYSPTTWSNRGSNGVSSVGIGGDLLGGGGIGNGSINSLLGLQNKQMVSRAIQTESAENGFGRGGCTCGCVCGRAAGAGVIGGGLRGSSSRASGGSASPPSVDSSSPTNYERFSPSTGIGSIGDRLNTHLVAPEVSSAPSSTSQSSAASAGSSGIRYYDPFGTADLLTGSRLSSLRIN